MNVRDADAMAAHAERHYDNSIPGYFRVMRRFWVYLKPYQSKFWLIFLLLLIAAPLAQFAAFLTRDVVNQALLATAKPIDERWAIVLRIVAIQALFWFLSALLSTVREVLEWYTSMRSTYDLRRAFYRHLHRLPLTFLRQRPPGEHLYRTTYDFGKPDGDGYDPGVMGMICRNFPQLIDQAYLIVWAGIFLALIDPILGIMLGIYMIPYLTVGWKLYDKVRLSDFEKRHREEAEMAVLRDSVAGLRTVKSMGREGYQRRQFMKFAVRKGRKHMQLVWWQTIADYLGLSAIRWIFNGIVLVYLSHRVITGEATIGDWAATAAILATLSSDEKTGAGVPKKPIERFFYYVQKIRMDMVPAQRIIETLNVTPDLADKPGATVLGPIKGRIEFKDVSFSYGVPDDGSGIAERTLNTASVEGLDSSSSRSAGGTPTPQALRGVSFAVEPGESVGFVGPSGAGKSSVLNLLLRLYAPQSGSITVDGVDTLDVKLDSLIDQVGLVPQSTYLYDDTIADNILFGNKDATPEELSDAAEASGVADFVARHPLGLDTPVGEGSKISGGERQRIGVARALIRDPKILILDEATANLDPHTESEILWTLKDVSRGRTTLTVAHRLKAVRHCDRIYVMDQGQIVESGSHDQLLKGNGLYAKLWRMQAETVEEALAAGPGGTA